MASKAIIIPSSAKCVPVPNPAKWLIKPSKLMPVAIIHISVITTARIVLTKAIILEPRTEATRMMTPATNSTAAMEIWLRKDMFSVTL